MSPQLKKLCRADNAADVIGPVESGERSIEKNGFRSTGRSTLSKSTRTLHIESNSFP